MDWNCGMEKEWTGIFLRKMPRNIFHGTTRLCCVAIHAAFMLPPPQSLRGQRSHVFNGHVLFVASSLNCNKGAESDRVEEAGTQCEVVSSAVDVKFHIVHSIFHSTVPVHIPVQ